MVEARKAKSLTQKQLGARVGTSQNVISLIEAGGVVASAFVLPICKQLGIAPPQFFETDDQRHWSQLGYLLASRNPRQFRRALELVESLLEEREASAREPGPTLPRNGEPKRR